ncbi:MJ0042 family finger-like domain-containing protein [Paracoccus isoporae]|uniref:MJ0042 family finger-like domain-containing protein n=1 Tax=Paracoccus isoporae TaxID=591205 RepID=A0A1G6TRF8_9RHOB|nr:zinc-ribbon domain-containing protein [Paracoccus isoporae]SDD30895.1 MJ0042 family finger-like domain-containing protein [Paracoccus isoporae]
MRLICPECNAQYELPEDAIPPEGREVECAACGTIWHQDQANKAPARSAEPPAGSRAPHSVPNADQPAHAEQPPAPDMETRPSRGLSDDLRAAAQSGDGQVRDGADPDLGDAPVLRRPLPDDVLSILREETARELRARRGIQPGAAQQDTAQPPKRPETAAPNRAGAEEAGPHSPPPRTDAVEPAPAAPARDAVAREPDPADDAPRLDAVQNAPDLDWPATTVTAPDDSEPRVVARGAARPHRAGQDGSAILTTAAPTDPAPVPRRNLPPEDVEPVATLPDAEIIAATLQPGRAATDARPPHEADRARHGYGAGMTRALIAVAALLILYLLAALWVRSGDAPAPIAGFVGGVETARAALQSLIGSGLR